MARSTGIVLAATAISFGNEWIDSNTPNLKIPVAGLGVALILDGIERLSEPAAVGLAYIMLITVLVTPIGGKSPVENLALYSSGQKQVK